MNEKYCIVTYSHTNCKDVWKPYFDRLDKYAPNIRSFWLCNENINDYGRHLCFKYDEKESFSKQILRPLEFLRGEGYKYFIYSQEDFVLYDLVNESALFDAIEQIKSGKTDFVKLIKSGDSEYCMQASIHDTDKFISFYKKYQIDSIRQEGFLRTSSIGEYESKWLPSEWVGNKRGMFHWDSKVWPYIATALVRGKWNLSEYNKELTEFKNEYMVDFNIRGTS